MSIEEIKFGVEIETTIPVAAGVVVGGYHSGRLLAGARQTQGGIVEAPTFNGHSWKAQSDGSIRPANYDQRGCEFVSPILKGEAGVRHLIEFVQFLRAIGAEVNPSCGVHIHVDLTDAANGEERTAYLERLAHLVAFNTRAIYAQTGTTSRERGHYCRPLDAIERRAIMSAKRSKNLVCCAMVNRYKLFNTAPVNSKGTVEFRAFAGTLNRSKILLHLFTVLALCIIARRTKTANPWANKNLSGEKALRNFLKVRPILEIVGAQVFREQWNGMLTVGFEMARRYDEARTAEGVPCA